MQTKPGAAPAVSILCATGEKAHQMTYQYFEQGGTKDAAAQLGLCEHQIVKSLVFDTGGQSHGHSAGVGIMALMHGDERVSLRKLERLSGIRHLEPCAPDRAEELTGYRPGGICPFGLPSSVPVFIQESLFDFDELYINAGRRGVIVRIRPQALLLVPGAVRGDFRSEGQHRTCTIQ